MVWSKKWNTLWNSFPIFDFDQRCFKPSGEVTEGNTSQAREDAIPNFIRVVDRSLSTRLEPMPNILKFKLHSSPYNRSLACHMNRWIRAALQKNVREFDIYVESKDSPYLLPQAALSCRSITFLKLYGIKFDSHTAIEPAQKKNTAIELCNLRVLSIKNARLDVNLIQNFVNGCPLIEDLRLAYCVGFSCLHVTNLAKLVSVEVHECSTLKEVEIDVPNLHTFSFHGWRDAKCEINLTGCANLKILILKNLDLTDDLLAKHLLMFQKLEKLTLSECRKLQRIAIFSDKIKRLSIVWCKKVNSVSVKAPRLISFEYIGDRMPLKLVDVTNLQELKLCFELSVAITDHDKLETLNSLIRKVNISQLSKLCVSLGKDVAIFDEVEGFWFHPSGKCKVELKSLLSDHAADSLLNGWPDVLSIVSPRNSELLQFLRDFIIGRSKKPKCCKHFSFKCWRHYLEGLNISEEINDQGHKTTFNFKWKPKMVWMG